MLAHPHHSRLVLINPCRPSELRAGVSGWRGAAATAALSERFGVATSIAGEHNPDALPVELRKSATIFETDGLTLWNDPFFQQHLPSANVGVLVLGGAWLEEDVFIAALEGIREGYDIRVLADLTVARFEPDRHLIFDRLGLHGVPATTVRQMLLEWAVCQNAPGMKQRIRQLLSR